MSRGSVALALLFATALSSPTKGLRLRDRDLGASTIPAGFSRCLFYDDFSQLNGSLPDPSKWQIDLGTSYPNGGPSNWGTGEIQTYTSDAANIRISQGNYLQITPVRSGNNSWTSARIETRSDWDFACQQGQRMRVESRIKLSSLAKGNSLGIWPAFWLLGSSYRTNYTSWPATGEVDILEAVNGDNKVYHTVHCGMYPGGICNEPNGIGHMSDGVDISAWHTFTWEVDRRTKPESMTWYIDGQGQWTLRDVDLGSEDAWNALASNSKMILLNVAVGGAFPNGVSGVNTPTNETLGGQPAGMEVDYVAVYSGSS